MRVLTKVLIAGAAPFVLGGAAMHITPTVVLHKEADVIRSTLPTATQFFLRKVTIGKADLDRIKQEDDFTPDEPEVKFYYGNDANGALAGVVVFPQVNTQHGPWEVGLTIGPDGTVTNAIVTKATVETKPWTETAIKAHLMDHFRGMRPGDDVTLALKSLDRDQLGKMSYFAAEKVAQAVGRGLTLYQVLYKTP
jgi:hypothetical protein